MLTILSKMVRAYLTEKGTLEPQVKVGRPGEHCRQREEPVHRLEARSVLGVFQEWHVGQSAVHEAA